MKQNEAGLALVEVIVAVAIAAIVTSGATLGVLQVMRGTEQSGEQITAIDQVQSAGYWLCSDAQKAQRLIVDNLTPPEFLIVNWTDWNSDEHEIIYTLEDMPGIEFKQFQRSESINEGAPITTLIAQYIDPDPTETNCETANGKLTLTITATVNMGSQTKSETRVFEVLPRPD